MRRINILTLLMVALLGTSCNDFFEESSQNQAYVQTMQDLNELLIGEGYIDVKGFYIWGSVEYDVPRDTYKYFPWIHVMDDDVTHFADGGYRDLSIYGTLFPVTERLEAAYGWQANPFSDPLLIEYPPHDWKNAYKRIAVLNSIIAEWDKMAAKESDKKFANRVKGEAYFLRAYNYFWLVNVYAQPYAVATAETEPGVPLKLSVEVEDRFFSRNTLAEVYQQIRRDLETSVAAFRQAEEPTRPIKANYGAACLLMSRVCLYMEDYEGAIAYADSVLKQEKYGLLDLSTVDVSNKREADVVYEESPETIFTQGVFIIPGIMLKEGFFAPNLNTYAVSQELYSLYHESDLRLKTYFLADTKYGADYVRCWKLRTNDAHLGDYMLMRFPEIYLNKAEAQAILGDEAGAKTTLNVLREKRFPYGEMPTIEEEMQLHGNTDLVSFVRDERRRELCFEGHRWFDLRRYAVSVKAPFSKTIRHDKRAWQGGPEGRFVTVGYYELKPYAEDRAAYVMPLPPEEIIFNEGVLKQNEARPERKVIPY